MKTIILFGLALVAVASAQRYYRDSDDHAGMGHTIHLRSPYKRDVDHAAMGHVKRSLPQKRSSRNAPVVARSADAMLARSLRSAPVVARSADAMLARSLRSAPVARSVSKRSANDAPAKLAAESQPETEENVKLNAKSLGMYGYPMYGGYGGYGGYGMGGYPMYGGYGYGR